MSFNNIDLVLKKVINQPGWEIQKQYFQILNIWQDLVSSKIAKNSRPSHISKKVLWIAVSNSVWSQELSLQRYSLLKKLNSHIEMNLKDIRFSNALWYQNSSSNQEQNNITSHPSYSEKKKVSFENISEGKTSLSAFKNWQDSLNLRSQNLSVCPQCCIPTPQGELDRWNKCSLCFTKN